MLAVDHAGAAQPLGLAACAVLSLLAAIAWGADGRAPEVSLAIAVGCLVAGASLGLTSARDAYRPPLLAWFEHQPDDDDPSIVEGLLREDGALTEFGASLVVDVTRAGTVSLGGTPLGGVRLAIGGSAAPAFVGQWRAGRTVRVPAQLRLPTTYRNPGLPDEQRALARRGIVLVGSVKSAALVEVVAMGGAISEAAAAARAWSRRTLAAYVGRRSMRSGAVVTAILIGDRSALSTDDERRLQEAGTYHVIAISGGNIAILTVLLLAAFRALRVPPRGAAALAIAALLFYAQLTGAPPSVARAVTAAVVYLAGRMLDQRGPPLNMLAVAAVAALCVSPLAAIDAGFILSFGATLGILLGGARLRDLLSRRFRRPRSLMFWRTGQADQRPLRGRRATFRLRAEAAGAAVMALLAASLCAELALAPAGAAMFSRITVAGLVLNFAAIPLMTVAQIAGMATLALAAVSESGAQACGAVAHAAAWGLVESARLVDVAPWLSRDVGPPAWWLMAGYYTACAALFTRFRRTAAVGVGCAAALMLAGPPFATRGTLLPRPGLLRVVFLDVGQGDATLVTLPDGRALLVDAGGLPGSSFDIGQRVVVPSLRALGVRRLEELVVTHGDPDHLGGALSVARRFMPRTIREGAPVPSHGGLRELSAHADASGALWRIVQAGDVDRIAGVEIRVLHPPPPDWERQRVRNDDSIVLELRFGDVSIVLPGDIGRVPELSLAPKLSLAKLVVLKAPHHGSNTSSTQPFIDAARPAAVIFSAGRNHHFGHPTPAVVARYTAAGVRIFGTPQDGAVIVETDGRELEIRTVSGRVRRFRRAPSRQ
jgi:competence protein ComEC